MALGATVWMSKKELEDELVETLCTVFGLREVRGTKVGNAAIRGVSGGQRKRISIAEALAAVLPGYALPHPLHVVQERLPRAADESFDWERMKAELARRGALLAQLVPHLERRRRARDCVRCLDNKWPGNCLLRRRGLGLKGSLRRSHRRHG